MKVLIPLVTNVSAFTPEERLEEFTTAVLDEKIISSFNADMRFRVHAMNANAIGLMGVIAKDIQITIFSDSGNGELLLLKEITLKGYQSESSYTGYINGLYEHTQDYIQEFGYVKKCVVEVGLVGFEGVGAALGKVVLGRTKILGVTLKDPKLEIYDFSKYERLPDGSMQINQAKSIKNLSASAFVDEASLTYYTSKIASLKGLLCIYYLGELMIYGFLKESTLLLKTSKKYIFDFNIEGVV